MSASHDFQPTSLEEAVSRQAEQALEKAAAARASVGEVIFGQKQVVEEALVTLFAGGHGLLVGVPGLAKTKLVDTLGAVLGLDARRVQFTPDLMPADILGSEVLDESEGGKALHELVSVFGAGKTLQHLLEHQSRGEDLLGTLESGTEGAHLRHAWLAITAKGQRPDGSVDQQTHRWRSRSAL